MTTRTLQEFPICVPSGVLEAKRFGPLRVLHFATAGPSRKVIVTEEIDSVEMSRLLQIWRRLDPLFRQCLLKRIEKRTIKETPAKTQGDLITDIKGRLRGLRDSGYDSDDEETQLLTRLLLLFGVTWPDQPGGKTA